MLKKIPKQWKHIQVNNILQRTMKETKYLWSCRDTAEGQDSFAVLGIYTVSIMQLWMQSSRHDFQINSEENWELIER